MRAPFILLVLTLPALAQGMPVMVNCSKTNPNNTWHWMEVGLQCHSTPPPGTEVTVHDDVDGNGDTVVIAPVTP